MPSEPETPEPIYHLALRDEWQQTSESGMSYHRSTLGASLDEVGFIHCSFASQVQRIADLVYRGRSDVLLLTIDRSRLDAEVRVENLEGGENLFPHIYGPLPLAAVVGAAPVPLDADGAALGRASPGRVVAATDRPMDRRDLSHLLTEVRACTVCAADLPAGPRPIVQVGEQTRVVIIGQAPGRRVHESGIPWDDPSGERLRRWLDLTPEQFYDPEIVALIPMGFCYPGSTASGDKPPRPECAPLWHEPLLDGLPADRLEIIIGAHAQRRYITDRKPTLTETVANWKHYLPRQAVLPHPSPRNHHWLTKNPWFETETLPAIKRRVREVAAE